MKLRKLILAARIGAWIALLSLPGKLISLQTMLRLTDTRPRAPRPSSIPPQQLAALVDRVFRADVADVLHRACWKRAAVLRRFLLLNGIDADVVFGVRAGFHQLEGHAWLERDGRPFLESSLTDYVITFRYPSRD
jgi:Transglutaminase-like superfamily